MKPNTYASGFWNKQEPKILADILVNPTLELLLGDIEGKNLLDLGCGAGNLSECFARKGARVTGIDIEDKWFPNPHHENSQYLKGNIINLPFLNKKFDLAYGSMVSLCLTNVELKRALSECYRVLDKEGRLIIADVHPTTLVQSKKPKLVIRNNRGINYFEHQKVSATLKDFDGKSCDIEYYHRPLSDYINIALASGFQLETLVEPRPDCVQNSKYKTLLEAENTQPSYILFKFKRGGRYE